MTRLDAELAARGLARSRTRAATLVSEGAVTVNGKPADKASQKVSRADAIVVNGGDHYVSRAAHKLLGALKDLDVSPEGRRCLDAGASTGGFTQVLLERGATHVDAIDVGHEQLAEELRTDPRVRAKEGFNLRDLTPGDLEAPADLVVADVSFISLTLLLPVLRSVCAPGATMLTMIKPQFELARADLDSHGVVRSAARRAEGIRRVTEAAAAAGLGLEGLALSRLPGPSGNIECFARFAVGNDDRGRMSPMLDDVAFLTDVADGGSPAPMRREDT